MLESGVEWELGARCHDYEEFLEEFLPCVGLSRVSSNPHLPPRKLYQLGIVDFHPMKMIQPLLILASQHEYDYSQRIRIWFLLGLILGICLNCLPIALPWISFLGNTLMSFYRRVDKQKCKTAETSL